MKFRKSAGLWSFGFAGLHVGYTCWETGLNWLTPPLSPFIQWGLASFGILITLAVTSNHFAVRRLRKNWKRLHRLVYFGGGTIMAHALLAMTSSKKLPFCDPQAVEELNIYLMILAILLAVRTPLIQRLIKQLRLLRRRDPIPEHPPIEVFSIVVPAHPPNQPNGQHPTHRLEEQIDAETWDEEEEQLEKVPF